MSMNLCVTDFKPYFLEISKVITFCPEAYRGMLYFLHEILKN